MPITALHGTYHEGIDASGQSLESLLLSCCHVGFGLPNLTFRL